MSGKSLYNVDLYHTASGWLLQAGVKVEAETEELAKAIAVKVLPYETTVRYAVTKLLDLDEPPVASTEPVPEPVADLRTDAEKAADEFVNSLSDEQKTLFEARLNSALSR
jgi:hypothetical protein